MEPITTCPSEETLIDLTYGELDSAHTAQIERHLDGCGVCTMTWTAIQETLELASHLPDQVVTPDPAIEVRLKRLVAAQRPWYHRMGHSLLLAIQAPIPAYQAILGGALLAIALFFITPPRQGEHPAGPLAERISTQPIAPRAPDPNAQTIPIQPVHAADTGYRRLELRNALEVIEPDGYAQAY